MDFDRGGINLYFYDEEELLSRKGVKDSEHFKKLLLELSEASRDIKAKLVLECSTKGDRRFSAFGAALKAFKCSQIIEFHYFMAKGFKGIKRPNYNSSWQEKMNYVKASKGRPWDYMILGNTKYEASLIFQWYDLLWLKYLDSNPDLVEYLQLFDDYNDIFKGSSKACQADSIRKYIKEGREKVLLDCKELNSLFPHKIR